MQLKTLKVTIGPRYNPRVCQVELNGISPDERLTPKLARQAMRIAAGVGATGTVVDTAAGYGYRLYEDSHRKIELDKLRSAPGRPRKKETEEA